MPEQTINRSHQNNLFNPNHARPVTILGCGSVGSNVVLSLAAMGVTSITVYDGDDVRSHNLPMTLAFSLNSLGHYKVDVVRERAEELYGTQIHSIPRMYQGEELKGSIISCMDTMKARRLAWERVRNQSLVEIFIDTRTDKNYLSLFVLNPCDPEHQRLYEHHLCKDSETIQRTCGDHGIIYMSLLSAGMAVRALTNCWNGHTLRPLEQFLLGEDQTHLYSAA